MAHLLRLIVAACTLLACTTVFALIPAESGCPPHPQPTFNAPGCTAENVSCAPETRPPGHPGNSSGQCFYGIAQTGSGVSGGYYFYGVQYLPVSSQCPANSSPAGTGTCSCNAGYREANGQCTTSNQDKDACWNLAVQGTLPGGVLTQDYRFQGNVTHGQQLCLENPGGGMSSPSKGCKVTFSRDAYLDYGGGNSVSEGTISMAPDSNTVDQSCTIGPNESPKPAPKPEKCPNGYTGIVNGVEVCINKVPDSGADGGRTDSETDDGTNTTTRRVDRSTNCVGDKCTTTTTTTTTVRNNSTGSTSTSTSTTTTTSSKPGFCQENPKSKLCSDGDDKGSSFSGSCGGGFQCEGDAIQCAMAQEQHRRACKLFDDQTPESRLYDAEKGKTGKRTDDLPGNETIAFGQSMYSDANMLGAGSCIGDVQADLMGQSITLPLSNICPMLGTLRLALLAFGALLWVIIVFRG